MNAMRLQPRWIIYERQPQWAPLLRRATRDAAPLIQTGSLDQCWDELRQRPGSAVLLQATRGNWLRVALGVCQARDADPTALLLAAVTELPRELRRALREAGLVYELVTPLDVPPAWRIVRRHFDRCPPLTLSLEQKIWNNLPWSPP